MSNSALTKRPEWQALLEHHKQIAATRTPDLFKQDRKRFDHFHLGLDGLLYDYSKNNITKETIDLLIDLARACELEKQRDDMFSGKAINKSENRAALHTALRRPASDKVEVDGKNIIPLIHETLERMEDFSEAIRSESLKGHGGKVITDVVNIGIGGSDIGPHMVYEALKPYAKPDFGIHFVSNVDASHINSALQNLNPETTIFILASKTFTTQETMTNAASAKEWIIKHYEDETATHSHFAAVTGNAEAARSFGIAEEKIFPLWDWVGGRFSLWSAIGLPICIAIGFKKFRELLNGAYDMDRHFQTAPLEKNIPVIMAMLGIWHRNFCKHSSLAVLPYAQNLHLFPSWLQQLEMESGGKSADNDGRKTDYATAPVVFGAVGTNAQHSFFQMLHQSNEIIPCDFIVPVNLPDAEEDHHEKLLANAIGQAQALLTGKQSKQTYRSFEGSRPNTTIALDNLEPYHLGMLLALYEHKVFVQGTIWNINSFDQWGVELGKELAKNILSALSGKTPQDHDSSTSGLVKHIKQRKKH